MLTPVLRRPTVEDTGCTQNYQRSLVEDHRGRAMSSCWPSPTIALSVCVVLFIIFRAALGVFRTQSFQFQNQYGSGRTSFPLTSTAIALGTSIPPASKEKNVLEDRSTKRRQCVARFFRNHLCFLSSWMRLTSFAQEGEPESAQFSGPPRPFLHLLFC